MMAEDTLRLRELSTTAFARPPSPAHNPATTTVTRDVTPPRSGLLPLLGLLLLATGVRLHGLDSQLWLDEIDAVLNSMRRPFHEILTLWPSNTRNPLYDLAGRACLLLIGETPAAVRLPAVLFGVGSVWMLHRMALDLFGSRTALLAGALLAVSYPHVFYSQNARGYTALVFFYLVASHFMLRWLRRGRLERWAAVVYALSGALAAYSVVLGIFVVLGHAVAALVARARGRAGPMIPLLGAILASLFLTGLLHAPFAASLWALGRRPERPPPELDSLYYLGVLQETIRGLGHAFLGPAGLAAAVALALVGALVWWKRDALSLVALCLPTALQLPLLVLGLPMSPRYFAMALPVLILALAVGLDRAASSAGSLATERRRRGLEAALLGTAVLATALPLRHYYRVPKQDFLGAIARVDRLAREGDARAAVHFASHALTDYYREAGFQPVGTLAELAALENRSARVWVVTTLEPYLASYDAGLLRHIRESYRPVEVLPATVARAEVHLYLREREPGSVRAGGSR